MIKESESKQQIIQTNENYRKIQQEVKEISGGYCGGVPPLPIPNREVKPTCADGTAMQCGRVGSCLFLQRSALKTEMFSGLFWVYAGSFLYLT